MDINKVNINTRKYMNDNNNYIEKSGVITHICPCCGNVYVTDIKLNVECSIYCNDTNGYSVTTPKINKVCSCGNKTIQIDNAMAEIAKILVMKNYVIKKCCEGHEYKINNIFSYSYPLIKLDGDISINQNNYDLKIINDKKGNTIITCNNIFDSRCSERCMKDINCNSCNLSFDIFKFNILNLMYKLVSSLPKITN